jgi:hypothetical protein
LCEPFDPSAFAANRGEVSTMTTPSATLEKALLAGTPAEYAAEFLDALAILSDVAARNAAARERPWCLGVQERVTNRVTTWANSASFSLMQNHKSPARRN